MKNFKVKKNENFNPTVLGESLCMNFDDVLSSFDEDPSKRIHGALGGYIYDMPQFPSDLVKGGIHYEKYVKLSTSLIPQRQHLLLRTFAEDVRDIIQPNSSFFDLGPGPEWSVRKNTIPALSILSPSSYIPVDLEPEFTEEACRVITKEFPDMEVSGLAINFHRETLPIPKTSTSIIWYPGSTLGNLPALPKKTFLKNKFARNHLTILRQFANDQRNKSDHTRYLM